MLVSEDKLEKTLGATMVIVNIMEMIILMN